MAGGSHSIQYCWCPLLIASSWDSPALLVFELWAGCPRGLAEAGSPTAEAQAGGRPAAAGRVMWCLCRPCLAVAVMETPASYSLAWHCFQVLGLGLARWGGMLSWHCLHWTHPGEWDTVGPVEEGASAGISGHVSGQPSPDPVLIPPCRC